MFRNVFAAMPVLYAKKKKKKISKVPGFYALMLSTRTAGILQVSY